MERMYVAALTSDKIFSVRDEFEQMRLREIRDNYLIPEPVSVAHCLKTEIRYKNTEVIHLSDITSLTTNQFTTQFMQNLQLIQHQECPNNK